jgi:hypothetical protein
MAPIDFTTFRTDFAEAVKQLEQTYGIKLELNGISYQDNGFTGRISAVKLSDTDKLINIIPSKWHANVSRLQLFYPEMYGKFFVYQDQIYAIAAFSKQSGFQCINLTKSVGENVSYINIDSKRQFERIDADFDTKPVYNAANLFPGHNFQPYHNVTKLVDGKLAIYVWDSREVLEFSDNEDMIAIYDNADLLSCVSDSGKPLKY